jgi:hypothetical protein
MSSVIVNGAHIPMGRLLGALRDLPATKLGELAAALCGGGGQGDALLLRVPNR